MQDIGRIDWPEPAGRESKSEILSWHAEGRILPRPTPEAENGETVERSVECGLPLARRPSNIVNERIKVMSWNE